MKLQRLDYTVILTFLAYSANAIATPVCLVILMKEMSLNLVDGGGLEAMRCVWGMLFLILSGCVAARGGKIRGLGYSSLLLGLGLFMYALSPNYAMVLVAMGVSGVGSGGLEGMINPLVQDLHPEDSGRYLNLTNAFWSVGVLGTALLAGEMLTHGISWRVLMAGIGVLSVVTGILFLVFRNEVEMHVNNSMAETAGHMWCILRHRTYWLFAAAMVCAGGAEGAYTYWSASYIQLCFNASPRAGGIGTACFAGGMILGRIAWGYLVGQDGLKKLIMLSALAGIVVSTGLLWISSFSGLCVVLVLAGVAVACFWPSLQSFAADVMDVDHTMLFILLSCAGIPGFGAVCWLMGLVGEWSGLWISFFMIPVVLLVLALTVLAVPRVKQGRHRYAADHAYPIIEPL